MSPVSIAGSNLLEVSEHDCTPEIANTALFTGPLITCNTQREPGNKATTNSCLHNVLHSFILALVNMPNCSIQSSISKHFSTLQEAGRTALMFAAEDGNMEAVKLLISAGADVNIRDKVRNLSSR